MAEGLRLDASVVSTTQIMGQSVYKASYFSALHGRVPAVRRRAFSPGSRRTNGKETEKETN